MGGEIIFFVGSHYELNATTSEITKYYLAGATRVAVRKYSVPASSELTYLLGDHLGSTSLATDETGTLLVETRYKAWGEVRYTTESSTLPTRYTYTGQYSYVADDATDLGNLGFGLMYYGARFYDPSTGRFSSADSIIPEQTQGTQAWDRYAYVNNNPIRYNDPSGHCLIVCTMAIGALISGGINAYSQWKETGTVDIRKVAVAAAIGAVGGLIGAALIAPAAAAVGSVVATTTGSAAVGITANYLFGGLASIGANGVLSNTQRAAEHAIDGDEITVDSVWDDVQENAGKDAFYGALGYGVGKVLGDIGAHFWTTPKNVAHLLNPNPIQKAIVGVAEAGAEAVSNAASDDELWHPE